MSFYPFLNINYSLYGIEKLRLFPLRVSYWHRGTPSLLSEYFYLYHSFAKLHMERSGFFIVDYLDTPYELKYSCINERLLHYSPGYSH